jgi:hypothetical protein
MVDWNKDFNATALLHYPRRNRSVSDIQTRKIEDAMETET